MKTIAEAALDALRILARPATVREICETVVDSRLYQFNTQVPEHVLAQQYEDMPKKLIG